MATSLVFACPIAGSAAATVRSAGARACSPSTLVLRRRRRLLISSSSTLPIIARAGGDGLSDLLARDKKAAGLLEEDVVEEMPAEFVIDGAEESRSEMSTSAASSSSSSEKKKKKTSSSSSSGEEEEDSDESTPVPGLDGVVPLTSSQAIDFGETALRSGDAALALRLFESALDLPGSAAVRFAGSVREYSCASDAEAAAALYNMSCAYVALGDLEPALTCLEGAVEGGGEDIASAARGDGDLEALRADKKGAFEDALRRGTRAFESAGSSAGGDGGGGGADGILGGLAARLLRTDGGRGGGGGKRKGSQAGRSVGVLERIMRPW